MGQLTLSNVRKSFGTAEVICGIDLKIGHGEFVVFVGPSGCGKSTLLRMIAGLEEITSGDVIIDDVIVNNLAPVKRGISMVFQSYALYPHMTVYENIAFPLRVDKLPNAEIKKKVDVAAEVLQLQDKLDFRPSALSGGQRQRVAIGRAIVREPSVFLFDEPLSNLDAALRSDMRVELAQLHKRLGATMIYVTHDQVEAMTMADRIVVLNAGEISQVGTPLELYHEPDNLFVAGFIGNPKMNFLDATVLAASVTTLKVRIEDIGEYAIPVDGSNASAGDKVRIGIRPEHIRVGGKGISLKYTATIIERLGIHTVTYAKRGKAGHSFSALLAEGDPIAEGVETSLTFAEVDCHVFDSKGKAFKRLQVSSYLPDAAVLAAKSA